MNVLVCSDSHGNNHALKKLVNLYPKMDLYLHAGDSESDEYSIYPFESVRGNCDYFSNFDERKLVHTEYGLLLMCHKPIENLTHLKDENIKIFIHGHTHKRRLENKDGIVIINPGAISFSRDKNELSFAILEISSKNIKVVFQSLIEKEDTNSVKNKEILCIQNTNK